MHKKTAGISGWWRWAFTSLVRGIVETQEVPFRQLNPKALALVGQSLPTSAAHVTQESYLTSRDALSF